MAVRGRKLKPAFLKLVTGNPGHRPIVEDAAHAASAGHDNGLEPPVKLKRRQAQLWAGYIRKAPWLTAFDVPRSFMWVELHTEFESDPSGMVAGKIAQLRALGSELGLDPASRQRIGGDDGGKQKDDPAAGYFG